MFRNICKSFLMIALLTGSFCCAAAFSTQDKMYIDDDSFKANTQGDLFYIHIGNNVWLVTHTIHRDSTGMFAYENTLSRLSDGCSMQYEKRWKCPYCYQYWPLGTSCQNKDCPSKYK